MKNEKGITLISIIISIVVIILLSSIVIYSIRNEEKIIEYINKIGKNVNEELNTDSLNNKETDMYNGTSEKDTNEDLILLEFPTINSNSVKIKLNIIDKKDEIVRVQYGIKEHNNSEYQYYDSTDINYTIYKLKDGTNYDIKAYIHDIIGKTIETSEYVVTTKTNIGKLINNYKTASEELDAALSNYTNYNNTYESPEWRFFYDDDYYYYLISGRYHTLDGNTIQSYSAGEIFEEISGYTTEEEMEEVLNAEVLEQKHLNDYLKCYCADDAPACNSSNEHDRLNAYFLDTNVWKSYKGEYADFAIGAVPFEMFFYSYNRVLNNSIEFRYIGNGQYYSKETQQVDWLLTDCFYCDTFKGGNVNYKLNGMYLISRNRHSAGTENEPFYVAKDEKLDKINITNKNFYNYQYLGIRPIVAIPKSRCILQEQSDGTMIIDEIPTSE